MKRCTLVLSVLLLIFLAAGPGVASASLLADHFGVYPKLGPGYSNYPYPPTSATYYPFVPSSLLPTKNTATTDYVIDNWTGKWSNMFWAYSTISGQYPSSAEPYDVEAYYFDDDPIHLYIAVITSFPPPPGYIEPRHSNLLIVSGDMALDLRRNGAFSGTDPFSYDYGVNINNEHRTSGNATPGGDAIGQGFYRTLNSAWYTGTPSHAVKAKGEATNFDPNDNPLLVKHLGDAFVEYYSLGLIEAGAPTYAIEASIPRSLFDIDLLSGQKIGVSWAEGCRNDGNTSQGILRFTSYADLDNNTAPVPEPASMLLFASGLAAWGVIHRRRRKAKS